MRSDVLSLLFPVEPPLVETELMLIGTMVRVSVSSLLSLKQSELGNIGTEAWSTWRNKAYKGNVCRPIRKASGEDKVIKVGPVPSS